MAKRAHARKGSNSSNSPYSAYVNYSGVDMVTGKIEKIDKNGVEFSFMRYGSRYRQFFPASQIIACIGATTSEESMLWFHNSNAALWRTGKRDRPIPLTDAPEAFGNFLMKSASPDFPIILLNNNNTHVIGKISGSNRGRKKKNSGSEEKSRREKPRRERTRPSGEKMADWPTT